MEILYKYTTQHNMISGSIEMVFYVNCSVILYILLYDVIKKKMFLSINIKKNF